MSDSRKHHATRARIHQLLDEGWSITGRDPVVLERPPRKMRVLANGALIDG